jgi:hypothetical protein
VIASGQATKKNELAVGVGRTFISDQGVPNTNFFDNTVHSGKGLSFSFNYAHDLHRFSWTTLALEIPVIYNPDEDLNLGQNVIPKQYSSLFATPSARLNFLHSFAFSPWISLGGGVGHFVASKDLVFYGTNTGHRIKTTGVMQGGIGFDVPRLPGIQSIGFRFEARDNWSGVPPINVNTGKTRQHNYYVGAAALYHF